MSGTTPTDRLTPVEAATGRTVYYHDERGTYHTWFDDAEYEPVSTALVYGVSAALDVDPDDLETLAECVDPDALNALLGHWRGSNPEYARGSVTFPFARCEITVRADGEIVIDPSRSSVA